MTKQIVSRVVVATFVCFLGLGARPASATPVHYVESSDQLNATNPLLNFTLDLGTNTVSGNVFTARLVFNPDTGEEDVIFGSDAFKYTVPAGMQVAEVKIFAFSYNFPNGAVNPSFTWGGDAGSMVVPLPGSDNTAFFSNVPLGPGTYEMRGGSFNNLSSGDVDYTFTFDVAAIPVPEPASLTLLALGVVSLLRRRR